MSKALDIAGERFARGEISENEFGAIVSALQSGERNEGATGTRAVHADLMPAMQGYEVPVADPADTGISVPADMVKHYNNVKHARSLSTSGGIIEHFVSFTVLVYIGVFMVLFVNRDDTTAMNNWLDILGSEVSADPTAQILAGIAVLPELVVMIAALVWIYRATANLFYLRVADLSVSPGWSVGWFFIPIASLWMPIKAMKQVFAATMYGHDWRKYSSNGRIVWWWITFWIANLISLALPSRISPENDVPTTLGVYGIYCAISILSIKLFSGVVKEVTERQTRELTVPQREF